MDGTINLADPVIGAIGNEETIQLGIEGHSPGHIQLRLRCRAIVAAEARGSIARDHGALSRETIHPLDSVAETVGEVEIAVRIDCNPSGLQCRRARSRRTGEHRTGS